MSRKSLQATASSAEAELDAGIGSDSSEGDSAPVWPISHAAFAARLRQAEYELSQGATHEQIRERHGAIVLRAALGE
jgi:hypothetical protein